MQLERREVMRTERVVRRENDRRLLARRVSESAIGWREGEVGRSRRDRGEKGRRGEVIRNLHRSAKSSTWTSTLLLSSCRTEESKSSNWLISSRTLLPETTRSLGGPSVLEGLRTMSCEPKLLLEGVRWNILPEKALQSVSTVIVIEMNCSK